MSTRVFACYDCDPDEPCVLVVPDAANDRFPRFCPFEKEARWKELILKEADA